MTFRSRIRTIALLACVAFPPAAAWVAAGCGTDGSGGDIRQRQEAECRAACANILSAGCEAASDEAACLEECRAIAETARASESAACHEAFDAWVTCAANEPLECEGFDVSMLPCRVHRDHTRNYCELGLGPDEPCLDNPVFDSLCPEEKPQAMSCRGRAPSECVVGGTDNHRDVFCCP